jgi:hypothetical protein
MFSFLTNSQAGFQSGCPFPFPLAVYLWPTFPHLHSICCWYFFIKVIVIGNGSNVVDLTFKIGNTAPWVRSHPEKLYKIITIFPTWNNSSKVKIRDFMVFKLFGYVWSLSLNILFSITFLHRVQSINIDVTVIYSFPIWQNLSFYGYTAGDTRFIISHETYMRRFTEIKLWYSDFRIIILSTCWNDDSLRYCWGTDGIIICISKIIDWKPQIKSWTNFHV